MRRRPVVAAGVLTTLTVTLWLFLAPVALGGQFGVVTTHGTSMKPRFTTGDLAVVHHRDSYAVGDVVAYHSRVLNRVVMHRIVGHDGRGFIFKGDNNDYLDPDRPSATDCIGALVVRVPHGGTWLHRGSSPPVLAVVAAALLLGGAGARTRHHRRRPKMSRHAARPSAPSTRNLASRSPVQWGASLLALLLGAALAVAGWTTSTTATAAHPREPASMTFSYSASVPRSAAYDSTVVSAPNPVFRKVTNAVTVTFQYAGRPGTLAVAASITAGSGWRTTVPLVPGKSLTSDRYVGSVDLDLTALQARATKAAAVIGVPTGQLTIGVTPTVRYVDGAQFTPTLTFIMTPDRLALGGDVSSLHVRSTRDGVDIVPVARKLRWGPVAVDVSTARTASLTLLIAAILTTIALFLLGMRRPAGGEGRQIRRRYARLLIAVQPMSTPATRPVVDVAEFTTLVRLADRYGLLILHWTRSGVETFVVQDESTTYRYRTGEYSRDELRPTLTDDTLVRAD